MTNAVDRNRLIWALTALFYATDPVGIVQEDDYRSSRKVPHAWDEYQIEARMIADRLHDQPAYLSAVDGVASEVFQEMFSRSDVVTTALSFAISRVIQAVQAAEERARHPVLQNVLPST